MTSQPEPGQALFVGAVVADTYQVTRLLGRGGMGSVWEASHLRLPGKRVAIKVLHADVAADHEALARFRREAEIATRLGHPNIVEVHDFNSLPDGQPYLVLELLIGESLESRLRRAPVPLDSAMGIAGQIGAALAAAHRHAVVHRDLKPQNVFLVRPRIDDGVEGGEVVKVLDFGISKIRGSQTVVTLDSTILGTPQYMAPEQATGNHAAVDQRTDVFALAAIVYEMLAGRPAFSGQSIPEVVFKVVYEQPPPLADLVPGLPPRVTEAVGRALAKKQDERFADVVSFVEEMAGVSLSTLRRAPLSPAPLAAAAGMDSTLAAGSTARSTQPMTPRPGAGADPLAHTVDSGRRELAEPAPRAESTPRAELPPPAEPTPLAELPPPEKPAAPRRLRPGLVATAALLLLAGAGAVIALMARSDDGGERPAPRSTRPPRPARAPGISSPREPSPAPSAAADPEPPAEEPPTPPASDHLARTRPDPAPPKRRTAGAGRARDVVDTAGDPADQGRRDPSTPGRAAERAAVVDGEQALLAGDFRQALVLAERALRHGAGPAAHALRARASCGIGDLANARASFLRIPRRRQDLRRRVLGSCTTSGIHLGP